MFLAAVQHQVKPAVIVFEDVPWAEGATLDLIEFIGRRVHRVHTLPMITYRDDELDARHPLWLLRYNMTLPGHMIPPLESVGAAALAATSEYAQRHAAWIQLFYEWAAFTNRPAMLQEIVLGMREPEAVWKMVANKMERTITTWKTTHPAWQAPERTP